MLLLSIKTVDFRTIIEHCVCYHNSDVLKYRQLILDADTGCFKYLTQIHEGIVPKQLENDGKKIKVNNDKVFVLDRTSKKKKLNTPMKAKDCARSLCFDIEMSSDEELNEPEPDPEP